MLNSLGYALLSMLARKPCTGYELAQLMEVFWQAKHSQIYPLLSKLEQEGWVTHELVEQNGRPDKKVVSLTESGRHHLIRWLEKPPAVPVIRDEFLAKVYAIWMVDSVTAKKLIRDRIDSFREKIVQRKSLLAQMEEEHGDNLTCPDYPHFGRWVVHQRKLRMEEEEIHWCEWVLTLLEANKNK